MIETPKQRLHGIQILRGLAALLVALFHISSNYQEIFGTSYLGNVFYFGDAAVDIFFVLSGFIIYVSSKKLIGSGKLSVYLKKRLVRIYPVYWISISYLIAYRLFLDESFSLDFWGYVKTFTLYPGHFMFNGVSWSLSYEMFFYLLFALLILSPFFQVILYFVLAGSLLNYFGFMAQDSFLLQFIFSPHHIQFALGVGFAWFLPKIRLLQPQHAGLLAFVGLALLFIWGNIFPVKHSFDVFFYGIISVVLIYALCGLEPWLKGRLVAPWIALGNASYSLYLLHLPIINFSLKFFHSREYGDGQSAFLITLVLLIVIIASHYFYLYVESKFVAAPKQVKLSNAINQNSPVAISSSTS